MGISPSNLHKELRTQVMDPCQDFQSHTFIFSTSLFSGRFHLFLLCLLMQLVSAAVRQSTWPYWLDLKLDLKYRVFRFQFGEIDTFLSKQSRLFFHHSFGDDNGEWLPIRTNLYQRIFNFLVNTNLFCLSFTNQELQKQISGSILMIWLGLVTLS